jgi:hypothetical protein
MIHNGIEYGLMQAYAEGFDILKNAASEDLPEDQRLRIDIAEVAEVWRRGSVITSWLLDLTAAALTRDPALSAYSGYVDDSGEGRWTIQAAIDESSTRRGAVSCALRPLPLAPGAYLRGQDSLRDAQRLRRTRGARCSGRQAMSTDPAVSMGATVAAAGISIPVTSTPAQGLLPLQPSGKLAPPCVLVVFGASGDLTKRLLVPALYNLRAANLLPEQFALVGIARSTLEHEAFRRELGTALRQFATAPVDAEHWCWLEERLYYTAGAFDDSETYARLERVLAEIEEAQGTGGQRLFYLGDTAQCLRPDRDAPRCLGVERAGRRASVAPRDHREAVWPRPCERARPQPTAADSSR